MFNRIEVNVLPAILQMNEMRITSDRSGEYILNIEFKYNDE